MPTKRYTATKATTTSAHRVGVDSRPTPVAASVATLPAQTRAAIASSTTAEVGQLVGEPVEHRLAREAPHDAEGAEQRG